jgi:hypothetical protein
MKEHTLAEMFFVEYTKFCDKLKLSIPELNYQIDNALKLSKDEMFLKYNNDILPLYPPNYKYKKVMPTYLLPGVYMPHTIWTTLDKNTQKSIAEYISLLTSICRMKNLGNQYGLNLDYLLFYGATLLVA